MQNVHQKLEAFLAQEKEQKERAQRCFVSYIRSVYLMKNKEVFDVFKLQVQEYAVSLGLATAPRVRFLSKALAEKAEKESQSVEEQSEEEELKSFKAQLIGTNFDLESQSFESEGAGGTEESGNEKQVYQSEQYADDEDENENLKDLDLLVVKRKDVFCLMGNQQSLEEPAKTKTGTKTKFKEAKKVLKRKFQVNRKVVFNQEGKAVQVWPPVQRAVIEENKEEDEVSGINVEKARERLKREDLEFDKREYSRKVKAKHREERMKAKVARREANKKKRQKSEEEDEDEVVAYLANNSEDDFDPSTLPDPDKLHLEKEEEQEERLAKRQHSESDNSDDEEQELTSVMRKKVRQQEGEEHAALDTSLSLAEDEELVLHLLRGLQ